MLPAITPRDKVLLPLAVLAEVQKEKAEKEQALARAEREHQLAEAAVACAETFVLEFVSESRKQRCCATREKHLGTIKKGPSDGLRI